MCTNLLQLVLFGEVIKVPKVIYSSFQSPSTLRVLYKSIFCIEEIFAFCLNVVDKVF